MSSGWRGMVVIALIGCATMRCGGRPNGVRAGQSRLTILYPASYDERITGPLWADAARFLVFLALTEETQRGEVQGRLAERWEHSPDRREWTFHLRQEVRWHDGVPVTARDVAFSLDLYRNLALEWDAPGAYTERVVDDSTLIVTYPAPVRDPLHEWKVIWPAHLLAGLDPVHVLEWDFWVHPVGDGPYRYVRHVPKTMLELEANPDYYAGKPRIEHLILKFGGSRPIAELESGNVDAVRLFNQADLPRIARDTRFRAYHSVEPIGLQGIFWNEHSPLFRDPLVRRALTFAIDRKELLGVVNLPPDVRIPDAVFTDREYLRGDLPEPLPYDPDSAARLLDQAGWRDTDGDGVRDRNGRPFRFVALIPGGGPMALGRTPAYVQDRLRRLGVRMELEAMEASVLGTRMRAGDFEAAFFFFHNAIDAGPWEWFGPSSPIGYRNARMIAGLEAVKATTDLVEVERIYRELTPVFRADMPVTFLFPQVTTFVAHRRVRGIEGGFAESWITDLWLDEGQRPRRPR